VLDIVPYAFCFLVWSQGVTGQDGSYLAELLLSKGYEVHGIIRRSSSFNTARIEHLYRDQHDVTRFYMHYGDLTDGSNLTAIVAKTKPHEIYNLAAQSHVKVSTESRIVVNLKLCNPY